MSTSDEPQVLGTGDDAAGAEEAPERLTLETKIDSPSTCQRHITVVVPREDIDRYFSKAVNEMMDKAQVPGFRQGRAPRKLVEARFKKDVGDQVKGSLLLDSINQVIEDAKFAAISEPDFDASVIDLPDSGSLTFEFNIEVRPEFTLPEWKGLAVDKPVRDFNEKDVDRRLELFLHRSGKLAPHNGPAESGDYLTTNLSFRRGDEEISARKEVVVRIRPVLSFRDGRIEDFEKVMVGIAAGETRRAEAKISADAPNPSLRGQTITASFEVLDVKRLELPELTEEYARGLGFEGIEDLRKEVLASLQRQLDHEQRQTARRQIAAQLTAGANWELPPSLLRRQSRRELERAVMELRRNGFSDSEIQAHENQLRQNSAQSTATALKEHFILERIAEEQKIDADEQDFDHEIHLMAAQSDESPRKVRARLEKGGLMDVLRNQVIERKVIDLVLEHAKFKEVAWRPPALDTEAIDESAGGEGVDAEIPEAKHPDDARPLKPADEHS